MKKLKKKKKKKKNHHKLTQNLCIKFCEIFKTLEELIT